MNKAKRIASVALCGMLIGSMFAGCSSSGDTAKLVKESEINDETLIIAYYDEKTPFFTKDKDGKYTGLEADLMSMVFDSIKDSCKTYTYVKVDDSYRLGEDTAYTDKDGMTYIAYMAVGGNERNDDTNNEDFSLTQPIISDRIITVTASGSKVADYASFDGATVGTVSEKAKTVFEKNNAISSVCKSVKAYDTEENALKDLDSGKIDAVVTDEFSYRTVDGTDKYTELKGELDKIDYCFATAKYDRLKDALNEAIYELKSPNYNDKDEFTPVVEKYFGYNASSFDYTPVEE